MLNKKFNQLLFIYVLMVPVWLSFYPRDGNPLSTWVGEVLVVNLTALLVGLVIGHVPGGIHRLSFGEWPDWQIWMCAPFTFFFILLYYIGYLVE